MDPLTAARIQTVREHMRLECENDWDGVIATFAHPRYELYGGCSTAKQRARQSELSSHAGTIRPLPASGER
jgi:hypothetical protein